MLEILNCVACGRQPADKHHIRSRKSGGPDVEWNLIPLCREHHVMIHVKGNTYTCNMNTKIRDWFIKNGWVKENVLGKWKWYHPSLIEIDRVRE